jgi:Transposase DDE domain
LYVSSTKNQELSDVKGTIFSILDQTKDEAEKPMKETSKKLLWTILCLFLSIKGRINFLQLARYSKYCEQTFRSFFALSFDFSIINHALIKKYVPGEKINVFDPSHISKSGKKTPGLGYFWSGVAGAMKPGLELCGLAVVDVVRRTAFHLEAFQTIGLLEDQSLLSFYVQEILKRSHQLKTISKYMVVDAFFSNKTFIKPLIDEGLHVISRARNDSDIRLRFQGEQKGRGRKKHYGSKVDWYGFMKNPPEKKPRKGKVSEEKEVEKTDLKPVSDLEKERIFNFEGYSSSQKRWLNIVLVVSESASGKESYQIYFSTNLSQNWEQILGHYRLRFQIEFLYRDAKQHTGLNDCEARNEKKIYFHWNAALTAINIAKIAYWIPKKDKALNQEVPFSMMGCKTLNNNMLYLGFIFSKFGINPELAKNKHRITELLGFGRL